MNTKRNTHTITRTILTAGAALIAVGFAASARPAAAQASLLSRPAQVLQGYGDRNYDNQNRDGDHNHDWNRDNGRNHDRDRQRAEQARRDAERARYQAMQRRAQYLRDHRNDRDHNDRNHTDRNHNGYGNGNRDRDHNDQRDNR